MPFNFNYHLQYIIIIFLQLVSIESNQNDLKEVEVIDEENTSTFLPDVLKKSISTFPTSETIHNQKFRATLKTKSHIKISQLNALNNTRKKFKKLLNTETDYNNGGGIQTKPLLLYITLPCFIGKIFKCMKSYFPNVNCRCWNVYCNVMHCNSKKRMLL